MLVVLILAFVLQLGVGTLGGFLLRYVGESAVKTLRNVFGNICCICQSAILMTTSRGKQFATRQWYFRDQRTSHLAISQLCHWLDPIGRFDDHLVFDGLEDGCDHVQCGAFDHLDHVANRQDHVKTRTPVASSDRRFQCGCQRKLSEIRLIKASNGEASEQENGRRNIGAILPSGSRMRKSVRFCSQSWRRPCWAYS